MKLTVSLLIAMLMSLIGITACASLTTDFPVVRDGSCVVQILGDRWGVHFEEDLEHAKEGCIRRYGPHYCLKEFHQYTMERDYTAICGLRINNKNEDEKPL